MKRNFSPRVLMGERVRLEPLEMPLHEAFETLNCIRVSSRVDEENTVSRKAVERIGAKYGG